MPGGAGGPLLEVTTATRYPLKSRDPKIAFYGNWQQVSATMVVFFTAKCENGLIDGGKMPRNGAIRRNIPDPLEPSDRAILRELLQNGRATNAELAAAAKISESACFRRLKRLEDNGVIQNYTVRINPAAVGMNIIAVVSIGLANQSDDEVMKFEKAVAKVPEVLECSLLTGTPDYLLRVAVSDLEGLERLYATVLRRLPGVARFSSNLVLRSVVSKISLPV
jgi:Lrp/AsnC family leucine-responsive transcriptional regulator